MKVFCPLKITEQALVKRGHSQSPELPVCSVQTFRYDCVSHCSSAWEENMTSLMDEVTLSGEHIQTRLLLKSEA